MLTFNAPPSTTLPTNYLVAAMDRFSLYVECENHELDRQSRSTGRQASKIQKFRRPAPFFERTLKAIGTLEKVEGTED